MRHPAKTSEDGTAANGGARDRVLDVLVVGGGQAGLAAGYYLRRSGLSFTNLDAEEGPGGAWRNGWDSLTAFSPAPHSWLPGWPMPGGKAMYPARGEVTGYFAAYEERYRLPVYRPVWVESVGRDGDVLVARARSRSGVARVRARTMISASGLWRRPYVPRYPGQVGTTRAPIGDPSPSVPNRIDAVGVRLTLKVAPSAAAVVRGHHRSASRRRLSRRLLG